MANHTPTPPNRFRPGLNGNPGGPKGRPLTAILTDMLAREALPTEFKTVGEQVAAALLRAATGGDRAAIRDVFNRVEGKVPDVVIQETFEATRADLLRSILDPYVSPEEDDGPGAIRQAD